MVHILLLFDLDLLSVQFCLLIEALQHFLVLLAVCICSRIGHRCFLSIAPGALLQKTRLNLGLHVCPLLRPLHLLRNFLLCLCPCLFACLLGPFLLERSPVHRLRRPCLWRARGL